MLLPRLCAGAAVALAFLGAGSSAAASATRVCPRLPPPGRTAGWGAVIGELAAFAQCRAAKANMLAGPPPAALRGRVPTLLPTRQRVVALTFDAGGDDGGLPRIYETLIRLRAQATFFMTGHFASYYPGWARRVAVRFPICNHTFDHADLLPLADAEVRSEVVLASRTIRRITGVVPQPLFRFPYGTYDARTLRIVNSLGYAAVGWTVDTAGWLGVARGQSVASVVRRVLAGLQPGAIILMHVGATPADKSILDADALATVVEQVRKRGYRLVALPAAYAALYPAWARG